MHVCTHTDKHKYAGTLAYIYIYIDVYMHLYRCKNIDILVITSTAAEQQQRVSIRYIERETRKGICRSKRKKHKRCRKINEPWAGHAILHVFFGVSKREFISYMSSNISNSYADLFVHRSHG